MYRILKTLPFQVPQCSKYNYVHYPQCHADIHFIKVTEKKDYARKSLSEKYSKTDYQNNYGKPTDNLNSIFKK